jgi:putative membrane protein
LERFLKGIIVGLGGIAPGLSGTVLLILMGLYQPVLHALGTVFTDFKKKIRFLLPVVGGMIFGVLAFGRVIDYCLENWGMPTRFCFLGLVLGTVPMLWKKVKKNGLKWGHWCLIAGGILLGILLFAFHGESVTQILHPNFLQSVGLGVAVAASSIIPGVDPTALLSSIGLYEAYIRALGNLELVILAPLAIGLVTGAMVISKVMSWLLIKFYTPAYCLIFGTFLTMIPSVLGKQPGFGWNGETLLSLALAIIGFVVSLLLSRLENK